MSPVISANGRYVAFSARGPWLKESLPPDSIWTNYVDIHVYDRQKDKSRQVDIDRNGNQEIVPFPVYEDYLLRELFPVGLSPNGRFVAFPSRWSHFVPNDVNNAYDIFVRDLKTDRIERVSVDSSGRESDAYSMGHISFSSDGRFVSFVTNAGLASGDTEGNSCDTLVTDAPLCVRDGSYDEDVYIYDRSTGASELVSRYSNGKTVPACGNPCSGWMGPAGMDALGRYLTFFNWGSGYVPKDSNSEHDFFLRDRGTNLGVSRVFTGRTRLAQSSERREQAQVLVLEEATGTDLSEKDPLRGRIRQARIAVRPTLDDLFVRIDVERLDLGGVVYAIAFSANSTRYEVRIARAGLGAPRFGLFRCSRAGGCALVESLEGGFGTLGESVVAVVPLDALDLDQGGSLSLHRAYAGLGSFVSGAREIIDLLR
jgi:hypothetical protein